MWSSRIYKEIWSCLVVINCHIMLSKLRVLLIYLISLYTILQIKRCWLLSKDLGCSCWIWTLGRCFFRRNWGWPSNTILQKNCTLRLFILGLFTFTFYLLSKLHRLRVLFIQLIFINFVKRRKRSCLFFLTWLSKHCIKLLRCGTRSSKLLTSNKRLLFIELSSTS